MTKGEKRKVWTPNVAVDRDYRVAIVGLAVTYAGCENKDAFYETLMKGEVNSKPLSATRLDSINKEMHLLKARSKYSDSFCNDRFATLDETKYRSEHDFLLSLAQDALQDYKVMKGNTTALINETQDNMGIISGSLSFPRDNQQGELSLVYQSHVERKLKELLPEHSLLSNHSPWSARPEAFRTFEGSEAERKAFTEDVRQRTDPASFVAEELGFERNSISYCIDAACATSLYVLRLAQEHLMNGDADVMMCGASTLCDSFFILSGFSTFQALPVKDSAGDISAPWRKGSTGLTPGEGGCVVLMKRLEDAVRDEDHIYGTMLACGINNAGTGLPLKPLLDSELSCLRETYALIHHYYSGTLDSQMDKYIQYVECHATGTSQGDQVELDSMKTCYEEKKIAFPLFGSAKGNFGHTLVAAGFAGLCKLLLSMEKGVIPPTPALHDKQGTFPQDFSMFLSISCCS